MKITGKRIIQKVVAIFIIMMMTLSDFAIVGMSAISYAMDMVATNSDNVEFSAYFMNENKDKVTSTESIINAQDLKMYVEIAVKKEGYFNGQITLENSNFNLKKDILSDSINQIEGNTVTLNKINANSTAIIELGVEYNNSEKISVASLNQESTIKLTGTYVSSKKDKSIAGETKLRIDWKSGDETKLEMTAKVLTNSVHKVNDANKRVVQVLVNSKLANNSYPVKTTDIELNVPEGAEEVKVHARKTEATSSDIDFGTGNYDYNSENKILKINLSNKEANGLVNWKKNAADTIVITYLYDEKVDLSGKVLTVKDTINTFDNRQLNSNTKLVLDEEKNGVITVDTERTENSIYKGKIYTGEDREYKTTTIMNVDYANVVDQIILDEKESEFLIGKDAKKSNIQYVQSRINKSDIQKLLGEEGTIDVTDQDENIVIDINKDTSTDEEGYINIKYNNNVRSIKMKMSKPVINGTLNIEHLKKISDSNLSREEVKNTDKISQKIYVGYKQTNGENIKNGIETKLELKDVNSQIKVETNKHTLTTKTKNQGLKIISTLLTNSEDKQLYKNPTIKISLPEDVENIENVKSSPMWGNGLNIKDTKVAKEGNRKIINIELEGEQKKYSDEAIEGTKIFVEMDAVINKMATNKEEKIVVEVSNENEEKNTKVEEKIEIINPNAIITSNDISEYNVNTTENNETKNVELDINSEEKKVTIKSKIVNNESVPIKNVNIIGELPTNNSKNNIGITIDSGVKISSSNTNKAKIYYTEVENATNDINNLDNKWQEKITNKVTKYLIIMDQLDSGEEISYSYQIKIPQNLKYNMQASEGYQVIYDTNLENAKELKSTYLVLTTGVGADLKQELKAYIGQNEIKDKEEIRSGEIVKYEVTIENNGNAVAENINVQGIVPDGTSRVIEETSKDEQGGTTKKYKTTDDKNVTFDNLKIEPGKSKVLSYEVKVNDDVEDGKETSCQVITTYKNQNLTNTINHVVKLANLTLELSTITRMESTIKSGFNYDYVLKVKNNTGVEKNKIKVKIAKNELLSVNQIVYGIDEQTYNILNKDEFEIEKIRAGETIEVIITTIAEQDINNINQAKISASAIDDNTTYYSNAVIEEVETVKIDTKMISKSNSDKKDNYVSSGDVINYTITLKNNGKVDAKSLVIKDKVTNYVTIKSVKANGKDIQYKTDTVLEEKGSYSVLSMSLELKAGEEIVIVITASVNEIQSNEILKITNKLTVSNDITVSDIEGDTYLLDNTKKVVSEQDAEKQSIGYTKGNNTGSDTNNGNTEEYTISGTIWYDENKDGMKTTQEQKLENINVYLINTSNNKVIATAKSDNEGFYTFTKVQKGKYIIAFEYDRNLYIPTTYQAKGIDATQNSDAIQSTIKINGEERTLAVTDTINLKKNISNIDLGLIKAEKFNLELNKYVTKMTVVTSKQTKTYNFNNSNLAKVEIAAKELKNATVLIEYVIEIRNTGELSGYVQSIVDNKPSELEFSSNLNKNWYSSDKKLYNNSLKNTEIKAGETKEIKLVLTKTMTESNTGLTNNTAEIAKAYNNSGVSDIDSTPNNNGKEDDLGSADIIISVKTGAVIRYTLLTLTIVVILAGIAYVINKRIIIKKIKV